jgi:hypothetical protein
MKDNQAPKSPNSAETGKQAPGVAGQPSGSHEGPVAGDATNTRGENVPSREGHSGGAKKGKFDPEVHSPQGVPQQPPQRQHLPNRPPYLVGSQASRKKVPPCRLAGGAFALGPAVHCGPPGAGLHIEELLENFPPAVLAPKGQAQEVIAAQHHGRAYAQPEPAAEQDAAHHAARYQQAAQQQVQGFVLSAVVQRCRALRSGVCRSFRRAEMVPSEPSRTGAMKHG